MVLDEWKIVSVDSPGNDAVFGGFDANRISKLLNGYADVGQVEIDSNFAFLQDRLKLRNSTNNNDITLDADPGQASNRFVLFPLLTADDRFTLQNATQTLTNKTFSTGSNKITGGTNTGDIPYYDSTAGKVVFLAKGLANQSLTMNGTATGLVWAAGGGGGGGGWDPNVSETITNKTINLTNNIVTDSLTALGDIAKSNGTKFVKLTRGAANTVLQCSATDVVYGLVGDSNIAAHTSTKISITDKTKLNTNIVYKDQNNAFGAFYQDLSQIAAPTSPSSGVRRLYVDSTSGQLTLKKSDGGTVSLEGSSYSPTNTETLQNKTIDSANNTLQHVLTSPSIKKFGYWYGVTPTAGDGIFNGFLQMLNGTATFNRSNTLGSYTALATGASNTNKCGIRTLDTFTARALNPTFKARFSIPNLSSCRVGFGLVSNVSDDQRNSDWLGGDSGAAFVYGTNRGNETSFYVSTNDGSTNSTMTGPIATAVANTVYTIEIVFDNANNKIKYSFNGGAFVDITSQIPASATLLGASWGIQTTTGSSKTLNAMTYECTSDK